MKFLHGDTVVHEYKGYKYMPEDDVEPQENVKRFHTVEAPDGKYLSIGLSPYVRHFEEIEFQQWVDMGCPKKEELGHRNNLQSGDISNYYRKNY